MGRCVINCCSVVLILGAVWSCETKKSDDQPDGYIAHLNMDSYVILASEIAANLEVPWDIEAGPGNWIWYTEQKGIIGRVHEKTGEVQELTRMEELYYRKSTGLLSMALHPDFEKHPYVFVHYTYASRDSSMLDRIGSRVIRWHFKNNSLTEKTTILDSIPGNTFHNGSRMLITEDGKLYLGCGDAGSTSVTQDPSVLNGKIIRINTDGTLPADNPFPGSPVWSMGHRNVQGITMGKGLLYASEHGPNNDDEINIIKPGGNYGWPEVHGYCDLESETTYCTDSLVKEPIKAWTPTIATSDLLYYDHSAIPQWKNHLILCSLKGQSIRLLELNEAGTEILKEHILFQKLFGRIRAITQGKDGSVYISTSNRDWHPGHQPWMYDDLPLERGDRIIKLRMASEAEEAKLARMSDPHEVRESLRPFDLPTENFAFKVTGEELVAGGQLYQTHCASCHRPDGKGSEGFIPPLVNSDWVSGSPTRLIDVVLGGLNTEIFVDGHTYQDEMPAYRHLQDQEIADILNYVRVSFSSSEGSIIAADVLHQRKGLP